MSKIEWTEKTWNPTVGCSKVSAGCENCYAMRMAYRHMHNPKIQHKYEGVARKTANGKINWTGKINLLEKELLKPLKTKKPTVWFVNSMSDIFHPNVPFYFIAEIYTVMAMCPQHKFQVLTKHPDRAVQYYTEYQLGLPLFMHNSIFELGFYQFMFDKWDKKKNKPAGNLRKDLQDMGWIIAEKDTKYAKKGTPILLDRLTLPNVHVGVSVENQQAADKRIPLLLKIPAAVRFLSCEPLLGPVDLSGVKYLVRHTDSVNGPANSPLCTLPFSERRRVVDYIKKPWYTASTIDWVIVGGESGPKARAVHPDWVRSLRDQCVAAGVPFFFKQWGEYYTTWKKSTTDESVFKMYTSYLQFTQKVWVKKGDMCVSIDGTICKSGLDFQKCAYPVAIMSRMGKKKAGRLLDGREWNEMPFAI